MSDFSEVGYHVRDVTLGMWCFPEKLGFCGTGAHPCCMKKVTLIERTVRLSQVSDSAIERFWEFHSERTSRLDNYW